MKIKVAFALLFWVFIMSPYFIGAQTRQKPLSVEEIEDLLRSGVSSPRLGEIIKQQGVNFKMADDIERRLRQAGADNGLILIMRGTPLPPSPPPDPIATLLSKARIQEQANKLTTPVGDNALETYQEVLQRAPGQTTAVAGIRKIKERYIQWGREAEKRTEWKKAETYYEKAWGIDPGDQLIVAALERVKKKTEKPPNRPPAITQRFPSESAVTIRLGEHRRFLAEAIDPDNDELTYVWLVDDRKVAEGKSFTFTASKTGAHRVVLEAADQDRLKVDISWNVQVEPPLAEPRLVMFTPHQNHLSLFLHESYFFGVQVEVPGSAEPSLRYEWTVDDQPVSTEEIFELKDQSLGKHNVAVTVTAPSGARIAQRWTVDVHGIGDNEDLPPLWWPRVRVAESRNVVTSLDQRQITVSGKVLNPDERRSANNIIVDVIARDRNLRPLSRSIALPTPQPLGPGEVGTFEVAVPNLAAIADFHVEVLMKSKEEEDHQRVKEKLVRRAEAAMQKAKWEEAEALIQIAMKVYPPDERILAQVLQRVRESMSQTRGFIAPPS
jgi:tetratricopeptide (TPR) repeat protein